MHDPLTQLGTGGDILTPPQRASLAEDGFCIFRNVLQPAKIRATLDEVNRLEAEEKATAGHEYQKCDDGALRIHNLLNKSLAFDIFYRHPLVVAAAQQILGDELKLSMLVSRNPIQGRAQKLHVDWRGRTLNPGDYQACTAMWLLEDYTTDNGPTRLVPSSHKDCVDPSSVLEDRFAPYPGEVRIVEKAGTLVVFNGHIWHAGTENISGRSRASLYAYFCKRTVPQELVLREVLSPSTVARFDAAERWLLELDLQAT